MCTTDGVTDGTSFGSTLVSSTAEVLLTRAALADYLSSPAATGPEGAAPGAVLASAGGVQPELAAARAVLLRRPDARDAGGGVSSFSAWLAAPGQDGPA
jgi:hypothetical protein